MLIHLINKDTNMVQSTIHTQNLGDLFIDATESIVVTEPQPSPEYRYFYDGAWAKTSKTIEGA